MCVHSKRPRVCVQNVPVCAFKTFPCVPATCAHVEKHVRVLPTYTGFSACHTPPTHRTPHTPHNTTHTTPHTQKDSFMRGFWWRFHRCSSWTRLSCPLCATTLAPVQLLTVEVPQVQLIEVILIPVAAQSLVPMALAVQQTMRFYGRSSSTRISHARC